MPTRTKQDPNCRHAVLPDLKKLPLVFRAGDIEDGNDVDHGVGVPDARPIPPLQHCHVQCNLLDL